VVSSDVSAEPLRAYNLTVEGWHTYFVAANVDAAPVWVHNWCLSSKIKQSPLLVREAQRSGRNIKVQEDIDRLTAQLRNGNLNPGKGSKPIGSGISEARGQNGGRVYFRVVGETVEILGKSGKSNQPRVIKEVLRIWGR
jgi:putative component of toxin-antitoxin plasmid stabilization module